MIELEKKYQLFIGATRFLTDNSILDNFGNFYKYKMLKVNLNNDGLIDDFDQSLFFNSYFSKQIDEKYFLKKGDILVKLIKPIEFFLITKNMDCIFNKSFCIIRSTKDDYENSLNLWSYLKINEKNISKKLSQQQFVSMINLKDIKKIRINEKSINKNLLKFFYKKSEFNNLLAKKQILLDRLFNYCKYKKEIV